MQQASEFMALFVDPSIFGSLICILDLHLLIIKTLQLPNCKGKRMYIILLSFIEFCLIRVLRRESLAAIPKQ